MKMFRVGTQRECNAYIDQPPDIRDFECFRIEMLNTLPLANDGNTRLIWFNNDNRQWGIYETMEEALSNMVNSGLIIPNRLDVADREILENILIRIDNPELTRMIHQHSEDISVRSETAAVATAANSGQQWRRPSHDTQRVLASRGRSALLRREAGIVSSSSDSPETPGEHTEGL